MRAQSIYSNHQSPSRDITEKFAIVSRLRYICADSRYIGSWLILLNTYVYRCSGEGLRNIYESPQFQHFINSIPVKETLGSYQPGCLGKVNHQEYGIILPSGCFGVFMFVM